MKNKIIRIILIIGFIIGLLISIYPLVSNLINSQDQLEVISEYESEIANIDEEKLKTKKQSAILYNQKLNQTVVISDPFDASVIDNADEPYYHILNFNNDGVLGYIKIPSINVNLPIYHGTDGEQMQRGVGHLPNTSFPIGGNSTHAVLSAHSGLSTATLFSDLIALTNGELFYIHILGEILAYEVDGIKVVKPTETSSLSIVPDEDYITLVTCTPFGINSHRLLVRGHRVTYNATQELEASKTSESAWYNEYIKAICLGVGGIITVFGVNIVSKRIRVKGRHKYK